MSIYMKAYIEQRNPKNNVYVNLDNHKEKTTLQPLLTTRYSAEQLINDYSYPSFYYNGPKSIRPDELAFDTRQKYQSLSQKTTGDDDNLIALSLPLDKLYDEYELATFNDPDETNKSTRLESELFHHALYQINDYEQQPLNLKGENAGFEEEDLKPYRIIFVFYVAE